MCSVFGLQMENYQGDLNDIVRASSGASGGAMGCASAHDQHQHHASSSDGLAASTWQHQFPGADPSNFSSSAAMDDVDRVNAFGDAFGDPFSAMRDPLLHELDVAAAAAAAAPTYFGSPNSADPIMNTSCSSTTMEDTTTSSFSGHSKMFEDDHMASPCNIFSRIQISPASCSSKQLPVSPCDSPVMAAAGLGVSPRGINAKAPAVLSSDMINANSSKGCLIDNSAGPLQISSPRNLGIKRRKSQAKKVVCIPAPAAANSRSSGEVVPSDLWAWRKYGQKPIKGSPYPRGYYRCSSSKGCSARKQVERSRNDPNMLVITYTSEHNHPWPTQRNALAGSTRSQPSKTNASASKSSLSSEPSIISPKEELKASSNDASLSPTVPAAASVKEEDIEDVIEKHQQVENNVDDAEFGEGNINYIPTQTYRPALPDHAAAQQSEDFFADLDEIETDPLNLLFPQGFSEEDDHEQHQHQHQHQQQRQKESKGMDPFSLFDWSSGDNTASF